MPETPACPARQEAEPIPVPRRVRAHLPFAHPLFVLSADRLDSVSRDDPVRRVSGRDVLSELGNIDGGGLPGDGRLVRVRGSLTPALRILYNAVLDAQGACTT